MLELFNLELLSVLTREDIERLEDDMSNLSILAFNRLLLSK